MEPPSPPEPPGFPNGLSVRYDDHGAGVGTGDAAVRHQQNQAEAQSSATAGTVISKQC